uniref:Putative secreted protein n=1 Tax=Ixodes ricinus TaxID=34613 RepID=A0A6B0UDA2_IXORI
MPAKEAVVAAFQLASALVFRRPSGCGATCGRMGFCHTCLCATARIVAGNAKRKSVCFLYSGCDNVRAPNSYWPIKKKKK